MQKFAWILVGLLAGVLIATSVPVGAHHNDTRFKRRLNRLENQVSTLRNQMATVRNKTVYMDTDGFYYAPILDEQVLSFDCQVGDDAIWVGDLQFDVRFLKCTEGSYPPQYRRGTEDFLKQASRS